MLHLSQSRLRARAAGFLFGVLALTAPVGPACGGTQQAAPRPLAEFPSLAGVNYGEPRTLDGTWVGSRWLRSGTGHFDYWPQVRPAFERDLQRIEQLGLGRVLRIFIGLDQMMAWDSQTGYAGFDSHAMANLAEAFDMLDSHGDRAIAVLYDQEEVASLGNFHFQALDGSHPEMRAGYVRATEEFMRRFGSRHTVIGWDLFNEAYNSLGSEGQLARPPAADPVSPNYSTATVHAWLRDLYLAAKRGSPTAWLTASDTTELYWRRSPDLRLYDGVLDFYDVHVYDDHPAYPDWKRLLPKPYIVGEAGASVSGAHYDDQTRNPPVLRYLLDNAQSAGVQVVLAHGHLLTAGGELTPSGQVLASYIAKHPAGGG